MKSQERLIIFLLAAINFTHILDFMIMMPLGNYLMPYFNISPGKFSILVGAYTLTAAVSGFVAAFFVDNYDRKKILIYAFVGFLIGTLACGLAPSYSLLVLARILAGLFGGLIGAQVLAIISDIFGYERRGMAMGAVMSSFAIASTLGVPFALYLANAISWHAPFILVGVLGIGLIPLLVKYIPEMKEHVQDKGSSKLKILREVIHNPKQVWALIFSSSIMLGHFLIIPFVNPFLEFNMGFAKSLTPIVYLVGGISAFVASFVLGRMSDSKGKLIIFTYSVLASAVMVLVITNMPHVPFPVVLVFFGLWFTVATGRAVTAQAMLSNVPPPAQRGSFMSFNSSVQQIGTSIASFLSGLIVIQATDSKLLRYDWVGYVSVFVLIGSLMLARWLFKGLDEEVAVSEASLVKKIVTS
ncbi:MAG: MFS transporter [Saprospiraceae bacterium]|jgi:predicted MFS family arabinose efflux permease|nr:MFS transporter [Saprospiraceae bacterium]MBK9681557.1 MFS transporter [Saprospiraceae bacterium]MBP7922738.1 MFS transporter [Saprospiraceae bacterium]